MTSTFTACTEIVLICVLIVKKHIEGTWSRKIGREVLEYTIYSESRKRLGHR
jgi:hypothetical protein